MGFPAPPVVAVSGMRKGIAIEVTAADVPQEEDYLKGSIAQVTETLKKFKQAGVTHVGLQFMISHWPERKEQIERFGHEALPALRN